jgi:hypothetical protein
MVFGISFLKERQIGLAHQFGFAVSSLEAIAETSNVGFL